MISETLYVVNREDWRKWLAENFQKKPEIWLIYPKKSSGKPRIVYNTAVEEALCFGWIDSKIKSLDEQHSMQRFSPRKAKSNFSQPNRERLQWLNENELIHASVQPEIEPILQEKFQNPEDIMAILKEDIQIWNNFQQFSDSYKRIRMAFIDSARNRPEEFEKRLKNFLEKTKQNKLIKGFGGIEKYY